jgi:hypothetical protein
MHWKEDENSVQTYFGFFGRGLTNFDFVTGQRLVMDWVLDKKIQPRDMNPNKNVLYHLLKLAVGDGHPCQEYMGIFKLFKLLFLTPSLVHYTDFHSIFGTLYHS